jgi:hypothetical protein
MTNVLTFFDRATQVCTIASIVVNILPNEKVLDGYPKSQKAYGLFIKVAAALAFNLRARLPGLCLAFLGFSKHQCDACGSPSAVPASASSGDGSEDHAANRDTVAAAEAGSNSGSITDNLKSKTK